ncbi:arsenite efflux transporter metallochaperone ArsD [Chrysiogenes arsenatis]|uniref:arsenite efflux transporter metallochaperone ArsD n=1 Tax=Chrysiogenes arsenatis TaxID=309797 RepID=UPI00041E6162|nr:arsenite efflux transporter metallochaperone ArsD [Chrysiogenes arsenatis]
MNITIYDPAMCCPTGVCGPSVDPELVRVNDLMKKAEAAGVSVTRYGLSTTPQAFVEKVEVSRLLQSEGNGVLPITYIGDVLFMQGRYPSNEEFMAAFRLNGVVVPIEAPRFKKAESCCGSSVAGVSKGKCC